jgi:hypothetical protein
LAETRRRGRSTRRRGTRTPVRLLGRQGARVRQQATPAGASPPCASPGGFTTARGRRRRRRRNLEAAAAKVSAVAAHGARAARARVGEVPGWRRALNSPVKGPWRAGHAGRERAVLGLGGGGGGVRGGADAGKGMTCGSPAVSDCERGREEAWAGWDESTCGLAVLLGWAAAACWAGLQRGVERAAAACCCAASWAERLATELEGRG